MRVAIRRTPSTVERPEDEPEASSRSRGERLGSAGLGRFRTLRAGDKIVETSLSRSTAPGDSTQTDSLDASVQDGPSAALFSEDDAAFEMDDRSRIVLSLLVRRESREVLERVLSTDDPAIQQKRLGEILLSSHDVLYSFARLVAEGGLTASDGRLRTTALTDRILKAITESTKP